MNAYGYCRVSTDLQAESGYGLDTQETAIQKYCKQHHIELVDIFSDEGVSGEEFQREGLSRLIASLKEGDRVIVLNTNRLWREDIAAGFIKYQIQKAKADVISIQQDGYSVYRNKDNPYGDFINKIMEGIDQLDRDMIIKKLKEGKITKAKNGVKACGTAPLGYMWKTQSKKRVIVQDPRTADIVQDIFKSYLKLKSLESVRKHLDEQGYVTGFNNRFSKMGIKKILKNRFYLGEVVWGNVKADGQHEPLISPVVFGKAQAMLERNRRR